MNYINGNFCSHTSGKWITNLNPATGEEICKVPISNSKDVKQAINSAKEVILIGVKIHLMRELFGWIE